jgi:hypothetical protein
LKLWLLNFAAAAALVLWLASTVLWVTSYRSWRWAAFKTERNEFRLGCASGQLEMWLSRVEPDFPLDENSRRWDFYTGQAPPRTFTWNGPKGAIWNGGGFGWFTGGANGVRFYSIYIPFWFEWLVMLVWAMWGARRLRAGWQKRRENRRRAAGLCTVCGYDLRGTAGACPECGKKSKSKA